MNSPLDAATEPAAATTPSSASLADAPSITVAIGTPIADDGEGMRAALKWSARGRGWTSPRPSVGCVLVNNGVVIGGGHTQPGNGNPHAEITAIRAAQQANLDTRGATAYVTLEPCSHFGTTPPCTDALIEARIARAVCGVRDPNPAVNGRGYELLRAAKIEVVEDFLQAECARAQDDFLKSITTQRPLVTLKLAASLDGKIATQSGESQWITNATSRRRAHQMRHQHDAVLVGIETVLADDPQLSVRLEGRWKQPARIVLDSTGRLPLDARLLHSPENPSHQRQRSDEEAAVRDDKKSATEGAARMSTHAATQSPPRIFIATTEAMPQSKRDELQARGAIVLVLPSTENRVSLPELWRALGEAGVCSVLIEGGAHVAGAALESGTVDKIAMFVAPRVLGSGGRSAIEGANVLHLADAALLHDVTTENLNGDTLITGYFTKLY